MGKKTVFVQFRTEPEFYQRIKAEADKRAMTMSTLIRWALMEFFADGNRESESAYTVPELAQAEDEYWDETERR